MPTIGLRGHGSCVSWGSEQEHQPHSGEGQVSLKLPSPEMRTGRGGAHAAFEPRGWGARLWSTFGHKRGLCRARGYKEEQAAGGQATLPQGGRVSGPSCCRRVPGCFEASGFLFCIHT